MKDLKDKLDDNDEKKIEEKENNNEESFEALDEYEFELE
jgi:hypothetical protein